MLSGAPKDSVIRAQAGEVLIIGVLSTVHSTLQGETNEVLSDAGVLIDHHSGLHEGCHITGHLADHLIGHLFEDLHRVGHPFVDLPQAGLQYADHH